MKRRVFALALVPSILVIASAHAEPYKAYTPPVVNGKVTPAPKKVTPPPKSVLIKPTAPAIAGKGGLSSGTAVKGSGLVSTGGANTIAAGGGNALPKANNLIGHDGGSFRR